MFKKKPAKKNVKIDDLQYAMAALGVMQDEICSSVPIDELIFSLRVDFNQKVKNTDLLQNLNAAVQKGWVKGNNSGWSLTQDGEKIADQILTQIYE